MAGSSQPTKQSALLYQFYEELADNVQEEFSTEELMAAADVLLKLSRDEYVPVKHTDYGSNANYFSHAVDTAIRQFPYTVLYQELKLQSQITETRAAVVTRLLRNHDDKRGQ